MAIRLSLPCFQQLQERFSRDLQFSEFIWMPLAPVLIPISWCPSANVFLSFQFGKSFAFRHSPWLRAIENRLRVATNTCLLYMHYGVYVRVWKSISSRGSLMCNCTETKISCVTVEQSSLIFMTVILTRFYLFIQSLNLITSNQNCFTIRRRIYPSTNGIVSFQLCRVKQLMLQEHQGWN